MHNCISKFILFLDTFILEPLHSIFLPLQFEFVLLGLNQNLDVLLKWRPWHPNFSIKIVCFFEIGTKCLTEAPRAAGRERDIVSREATRRMIFQLSRVVPGRIIVEIQWKWKRSLSLTLAEAAKTFVLAEPKLDAGRRKGQWFSECSVGSERAEGVGVWRGVGNGKWRKDWLSRR